MEQLDRSTQMMIPLESFLVSEFRAYQTLLKLTRQERKALIKADIFLLANLVDQKDTLMDEIHRLEKGRTQVVREWAEQHGLPATASIQQIIRHVPQVTGQRLERVRSGILAVSEELRDLSRGNQALAASALERLDHMRTLILSFDQPADEYISTGQKRIPQSAASIKLEERA
jgi:flagellar biosynthesis/type III secretory pathway chaperone